MRGRSYNHIFGACHLIGWDFLYPSSVERLLWRISNISCAVTPFLMVVLVMLMENNTWDSECIFLSILLFTLFFYLLARAYPLVAIFVSLRSVSRSAGIKRSTGRYIFHTYSIILLYVP